MNPGSAEEAIAAHGEALRQRLEAAIQALGLPGVDPDESTADVIQRLSSHARRAANAPAAWLLFVALSGCFPSPDDVADLRRQLDLAPEGGAMVASLGATLAAANRVANLNRTMRIESGATVVDVNFCATHEHNTGIQRVVRQTIPRWIEEGHDLVLVAWTSDGPAMRDLDHRERDRVINWGSPPSTSASEVGEADEIVVPWNSNVFLPEVPLERICSPLAALAEFSGNRVTALGYDAIPLVSADGQRAEESQRFANYLSLIKHSEAVFGISDTAASEFKAFVSTLPAQGLQGPAVTSVPLAVGVPDSAQSMHDVAEPSPDGVPLIVCVGSHEPRKNQDAVLHAAEVLFRQGQRFRLTFAGGGDRSNRHAFDKRVSALRASGLDVTSLRKVSDSILWDLYRTARFSIFISLHEGFGLPVAESLALGTPVLTSNFGSLAEIADGGGCVTVDPRSDAQIIAAIRKMLTQDDLIEALAAQARERAPRTWSDYARDLWDAADLAGRVS